MEEKKEEIIYETVSNLRIQFIDYAMEKYSLTKEQMSGFFKKYDQAVEYYEEKEQAKKGLKFVGAVAGSVIAGAGVMLINVAGYNVGEFIVASGITSGFLVLGTANALSLMKPTEEYSLTKKNPFIKQGTKFDSLAHEYCALKKSLK